MKRILWILMAVSALAVVGTIIGRIAFPPPAPAGSASRAVPPATDGILARTFHELAASRPAESGILPIANGLDAFTTRMVLINAAVKSIDLRSYIWRRDMTGLVMMKAILDAADRGVKVRLLLDDNGTSGFDRELAAFARHPNMEVRIFNPFVLRSLRPLNYAFDFFRLNRRMHNKSITVDGVATILGGRNIGDEYFSSGQGNFFIDLDILAAGAIVSDVSTDFDRYWASSSAIPANEIIPADRASLEDLQRDVGRAENSKEFASYRKALVKTELAKQIAAGDVPFNWVQARLYSDDPAKGLGQATNDQLMISKLEHDIGQPQHDVNLVSPYFVPGKEGSAIFSAWAKRGVKIQVLTNALEATDVVPVHAGYTKYRQRLLRAGVHIFELKRNTPETAMRRELGITGSSGSSLHAKTFSVDGRRIFIGSYNFDPRSTLLNCEMGVLIESPVMAGELDRFFVDRIPAAAYDVELTPDGNLQWTDLGEDGKPQVFATEPGSSVLSRAVLRILGWLPIEWLL